MRQYVRNILIYLVALLGIICFIGLFVNSLEIFDQINNEWIPYKVNAFIGDKIDKQSVYNGSILPVFGFVLPMAIAIVLIVESFKKSWSGYLKIINTVFAVILFLCVLVVLLTKELFLNVNGLNQTLIIRNGAGPRMCAVCAFIGAIVLLFATWLPFKSDIKFIDRQ